MEHRASPCIEDSLNPHSLTPTFFHLMKLIRLPHTILCLLGMVCSLVTAPAQQPAAAPAKLPAKENLHIYLLMGQSNMAGRDRRELDKQVDDSRILTLNPEGRWIVARDPIHQKFGRTEPGAGPGLSFAREMVKTNSKITIGLIPCAVGGSPLKRWVKKGDLYEQAVARATAAAQTGTIKGVLWHQGETDATNKVFAESYEARLVKMINDLRADLGTPKLPVVVGQLGDFLAESPETYPHADAVRAAIKHAPEMLPHVGYADSAGLGHKGDKLHFDADAARELGLRFAKSMQEVQRK